jgi:uncharacterized protein (DUF1800 family)
MTRRLRPIDPSSFTTESASHLLRRTVIGIRPAEVDRAVTQGLPATLAELFTPFEPDRRAIEHLRFDLVNSEVAPNDSPRSIQYFREKAFRYTEFRQWWCSTIASGPCSIQERLVLMWHMHFATSCNGAHYAEHTLDQNEDIRRHAFGDLRDLVQSVTLGLAMQAYLDGLANWWTPWHDSVNENHAREFLELHMLGHVGRTPEPLYSQDDVRRIARSFSGHHTVEEWSPNDDGTRSLYRQRTPLWREDRWDPSPNELFGERGSFRPSDVAPLVFRTRSADVALWFARRLCTEFVAMESELDRGDIEAVADLLIDSDWNIGTTLRVLLASEMFFDPRYRMRLVRTPLHLVLGTLRTFRATDVDDFSHPDRRRRADLLRRLALLGHLPYDPPNVSGWRRDLDWITPSDTAMRVDFCQRFARGQHRFWDDPSGEPQMVYDPLDVASTFADIEDPDRLAERVGIILLGSADPNLHASLRFVMRGAERTPEGIRRLFTHALSAPRYQLF